MRAPPPISPISPPESPSHSASARLRRALRLLFAALLLAGLLPACELPGASLVGLLRYERLDGSGPLWLPGQGNCVVHEFGTPSQGFHVAGSGFHVAGSGFHVAGSVGGLTARPPSAPVVPGDTPTALAAADGAADAAVLVVDDFAGNGHRLAPDVYELDGAETAAIAALVAGGGFSHGALVMHHVNATLAATGVYRLDAVDAEQVVWRHRGSGARLLVRKADVQGFDASVVPAAIDTGLRALAQQGIDRVAVNMSFALVPCSVVDDFLDNLAGFPAFEDYLRALAAGQNGAVDALIDGIRDATAGDPLRGFLQGDDFRAGGDRLLVAAAGNFSRDYAMYPAAWPEVLSVSASDATAPARPAFFTNAGEVLEPGAWFLLQGVGVSVEPDRRSRLAYAGTSFAAPAVAAMSAIDLASKAPRCADAPSDTTRLAHGGVDDVPLADAIDRFCR